MKETTAWHEHWIIFLQTQLLDSGHFFRKLMDEEDQFFQDINSLYQRQKVLFQKCCEQLKDIYMVYKKTYIF